MSKQIQSHILQLYEVKKLLGSGAYGHVWKVMDRFTKNQYALKKIFDAFHNEVDAQRTYREITVLHELDHPNIIKLHRVHKAKNNKDLYLLFQYMEADLHSLVGQDILQLVHIKFVIYQILKSLKYLHSAQLIHRDLKPSNILINSQCQIKICDFGLVRSLTHQQQQQLILSEEVATRWYRSPQMLLGSHHYGKKTDVWSVGCIIAEILIGRPIFPGQATLNQIQKIVQFTGIPSQENINSLKSDVAENILNQLLIKKKPIKSYFANSDQELVALTIKMLEFNPTKRISIDQCLNQSIFDEFKGQKYENDICKKFILPQLDDNERLGLKKYRQIIYRDIERRYGDGNMGNKSLIRSYHDQCRKFQRSHNSLKKRPNKSQQKSLIKKENSLYQPKKHPFVVQKGTTKTKCFNDSRLLPKVRSKKHLVHKSYISRQDKQNIKQLYSMYNTGKISKILK